MSSTITSPAIATDAPAQFYDPEGTRVQRSFTAAPRRSSLGGTTVALLSNQKRNADVLLEEIGRILREEHGVESVLTDKKVAMSLPAPADQLRSLAQRAEIIIVAVGDCGSCSATSVMDAVAAERLGVPAVPVLTDSFASGAEMVAKIQGAEGFPVAYVAHPIATLGADELKDRAREAVASAVRILEGTAQS